MQKIGCHMIIKRVEVGPMPTAFSMHVLAWGNRVAWLRKVMGRHGDFSTLVCAVQLLVEGEPSSRHRTNQFFEPGLPRPTTKTKQDKNTWLALIS